MNNYLINDYLGLGDSVSIKEKKSPRIAGILYENTYDDFGRPMLKEVSRNTVVLGGAICALEALTGVSANYKPATLNQILGINDGVTDTSGKYPTIALFGIGNGGAPMDFMSVNAKDIKSKNIPGMIPLRSCEEITGTDTGKYYMKQLNADGVSYRWYLKEFSDNIIIKSLWKDSAEEDIDGTEIVSDVSNSDRTEGIESFAELKIDLNRKDGREYYESIGELDMARYNTLGIYLGNKISLPDGTIDYVNVRLFAYTNFKNRDLSLPTDASYTYRIFALV